MWETWLQALDWEDPLEERKAIKNLQFPISPSTNPSHTAKIYFFNWRIITNSLYLTVCWTQCRQGMSREAGRRCKEPYELQTCFIGSWLMQQQLNSAQLYSASKSFSGGAHTRPHHHAHAQCHRWAQLVGHEGSGAREPDHRHLANCSLPTITLQYRVGFCHTSTWISHRYPHVPSL